MERAVVLATSNSVPVHVLPESVQHAAGVQIRRDPSGTLPADASLFEIVADFETRILADADGFVLILEAEGQAVGYIYAKAVTRPENAYVYAQRLMLVDQISIKPAYQSKGYGQKLMQAVRAEAVAQGIHRVLLDTYEFNSNAQQFYAKMGFERLSVRLALDFN